MLVTQIILAASAIGLLMVLHLVGRNLATAGEVLAEYKELLDQYRDSTRTQLATHEPESESPEPTEN